MNIFNLVLFQPLFNALIFLYQVLPGKDFGVAIIVLTILVRLLLFPLMKRSIKSQKVLSKLQPKIKEIQEKYKDDKEQQVKELNQLYQGEEINPFSGCLLLLIQLPILIALYRVFWYGVDADKMNLLYSFVSNPGEVSPFFLGIINLTESNTGLALLAGILQFFQTKTLLPKEESNKAKDKESQFTEIMQKQSLFLFPLSTVLILWKLPSAVSLYWIITALFSICQQHLVLKTKDEPRKITNN